ncbi:hypothetical protein [Helicobacter sp. T3_23-1056]
MKKLALFAFVAALGVLFTGCDDKPKQEATTTEAPATEATPAPEASTEAPATEATPAPEASTEAPATETKAEEAK